MKRFEWNVTISVYKTIHVAEQTASLKAHSPDLPEILFDFFTSAHLQTHQISNFTIFPLLLSFQLLWIYEQIPYDVEYISPVATGFIIHKTLHPLESQLAYSTRRQRWIVSHLNLLII